MYKILKGKFESFENIIDMIIYLYNNKKQHKSTVIVAIDGGGGAGKTTFASDIVQQLTEFQLGKKVEIVEMDDFYKPSCLRSKKSVSKKPVGADFDWRRLEKQVLQPLLKYKAVSYQKYDWPKDRLGDFKMIIPGGITMVEGVYSLRKELRIYYNFKIWIKCPESLRLQRGLERDDEQAREIWENEWMLAEKKYIRKHDPAEVADVVVDGMSRNAYN